MKCNRQAWHSQTHYFLFQKKHLSLAKEEGSDEEQEKAHTQLGRLYCDLFQKTSDISHLESAEENINKAYELAEEAVKHGCKDSQRTLAGAACNKGVLCRDLDDHGGAMKYLQQSLKVSFSGEPSGKPSSNNTCY